MSPAALREPAYAEAVTLGDALLRTAAAHPGEDALVMPEGRWTWRDLADRAEATARGLAALGAGRGDRVGVLLTNGFDCLASIFGVALTGATVVPINARFRTREMSHIVRHSNVLAVITSDAADDHVDLLGLLRDSVGGIPEGADPLHLELETAPDLRAIVLLGSRREPGVLDEATFLAGGERIEPELLATRRALLGVRDHAMVLYTSGTTSAPRGALISHESITRAWAGVGRNMRLTAGDRMWNPCPFFHIAAIGVCVACVLTGTTILTTTFFEPASSVELLAEHPPTALYPAYPVIALSLLRAPGFDRIDLSAATSLLCVGPPETVRGIQEALPEHLKVVSTFGMTESCGCASLHDLDDPEELRLSTSGPVLPGLEIRIQDPETFALCGPGEPGEIQLRGPVTCDGYLHDEAGTSALLDRDGWMHTGDRGSVDDRGQVRYLGRIKEMMKVGGESVSPAEIEGTLMTHDAVHMAAVVGVPDERLGEVPVAFVEFKPGASATEEELRAHCMALIARYKAPVSVRVVTEWPMSATKVRKVELRERVLAEREASAV